MAEWRTSASVHKANIGSGNGMSPVRHQAITWTNIVLLLNIP